MIAKGSQKGFFTGEYPEVKLRKLGILPLFEKGACEYQCKVLVETKPLLQCSFITNFAVLRFSLSSGFRGEPQHPLRKLFPVFPIHGRVNGNQSQLHVKRGETFLGPKPRLLLVCVYSL